MEIFRSILGFPRRNDFSRKPEKHNKDEDEPYKGEFFFYSNMPPFGDNWSSQFTESSRHDDDGFPGGGAPEFPRQHSDEGRSFAPFGFHMFDVFKHFDEIFKEFEKISIGGGNFDEEGFSFGGPPSGDLRDSMLKEPDSSEGIPPPRPPPPQFYDGMFESPEGYSQQPRVDTDLDEEVRRGNMEIVFGNRGHLSSEELLRPYAYPRGEDGQPIGRSFKSVTVRTYRSADGKVEERHTIQDGRGNEETTITRKLDDREYSVTTKRDYSGGEQVEEHYTNMDKDDKEEFNRMWKIRRGPPSKDIMHKDPGVIDKETKSIFRNLFGQSFPGFPSDLS